VRVISVAGKALLVLSSRKDRHIGTQGTDTSGRGYARGEEGGSSGACEDTSHKGDAYIYFNIRDNDDTLLDGEEVNKYKTSPLSTDTDGDGVADNLDVDPLVDLEVSVFVDRVRALDSVDVGSGADFYMTVVFNGVVAQTLYDGKDSDDIRPGWEFVYSADDSSPFVSVQFQLWDKDTASDDLCDIDRTSDGKTLEVSYNLRYGTWTGEDHIGDSNSYGHSSGEEDGSTDTDEDDCEIWFNIQQNDYDGDGLTWWEEVNVYGTDPGVRNDRYAVVLFCDGFSEQMNSWYWDLASSMYFILRDEYHFSDNNIYFLGHNSAGRDGIVDMDTTKSNIQQTFNTLSGIVDNNDQLFVFWIDHGYDGGFNVGSDTVTYQEAGKYISSIDASNMILCFQPCHSGGVVPTISGANRVVLTSCRQSETDNGWGELFRDGLKGNTADNFAPYGNGDGYVSMNEAYYYAAKKIFDKNGRHALIEDNINNGNAGSWYGDATYSPRDPNQDGYFASGTYIWR